MIKKCKNQARELKKNASFHKEITLRQALIDEKEKTKQLIEIIKNKELQKSLKQDINIVKIKRAAEKQNDMDEYNS